MRVLPMLALLMIVGCAAHRGRVNCEGHLKPINAPAHVASPDTSSQSGAVR